MLFFKALCVPVFADDSCLSAQHLPCNVGGGEYNMRKNSRGVVPLFYFQIDLMPVSKTSEAPCSKTCLVADVTHAQAQKYFSHCSEHYDPFAFLKQLPLALFN
ncbi:hypothetical protein BX070DRAFT_60321 [Coemansia spiralis]|nr:hypothetical protein BX070DRAFT_60321 [Coemansia spiralis]